MISSAKRLFFAVAWTCLMISQALGSGDELQRAGRRPLAAVCSKDDHCDIDQFCLHPGFYTVTGACTSCWRCCLFPRVYGACPERCNCNVGQTCESRDTCGRGLFCSVQDPAEMPMCQRCDNCTQDSYEILGSCAISCPSADMSGLTGIPHLHPDQFVFLSFVAYEVSQQGAYVPGTLLEEELSSWVQSQGIQSPQADLAVTRMLAGGSGAVATKVWMELVSETSSTALLCPAYNLNKTWDQQPLLSSKGCYCNATKDARTFRCPTGQRCSPGTFVGLETDALSDPTATVLRAVCVLCEEGQFCAEGAFAQDETALGALECPAGFFCPNPGEKVPCPAGWFCTHRSTEPLTCDYETLMATSPNLELPMEPQSVIVRVRDERDPVRGNYCPLQSTKPYGVCSAGHYCPNTSAMLVCPRGYYCKAQSTAPWKCPMLTSCPEGTTVPALSYMALVIAGIVICGIPLIHLAFTHLDNSVIMEADESGDRRELHRAAAASRMTFRLLKSIKLSGSPLENKYRGFGQVSPPITMEFESLGLQIRPRGGEFKNVLMGVSGSFAPRRLNAILGPSGCGKTTFLNVLCGKTSTGTVKGQVRINTEDMPVTRLKKIMGFVPQDDIVHEDLTVRENLNYSARLRLPSDMTRQRRRDVVHDALEMLGLSPIQNYRVGTVEKRGISGGQRKRVNIGLELVAMPSLLFLDEPTSGLDATSSADILSSLVDMTNLGMNIIMVIHQPRFSSFLMFDQVLLLGGGGHTVYLGSPSAAMLYFTKYLGYRFPDRENPSDILMDIIAGKVPCAGDPRLKTCSQLVEKWTRGGMAWVETLETLNPTMVTKMSDVDPAIILAIDDEFDVLDEACSGQINAVQLVKLFSALGQDISLEDAIILIRKTNANRPASAKSPRSVATSGSGVMMPEDADGLTVTKQQLLDAFQGVRDGNDDVAVDGGPQRNAAAKFYASHFLLPDLPEIKTYREELERQRRGQRSSYSAGGELHSGSVPDTASAGYSSNLAGERLDSDSYSPTVVGNLLSGGGGAADTAAASPVVESVMPHGILSPVRNGNRHVRDASGRSTRAAPLIPGLALNGSVTAAAVRAEAVGRSDGDGDDAAAGDLTAFAARRRESAMRVKRRKPRGQVSPAVATANGELDTGDEAFDCHEDSFEDEYQLSVAPGLVASSLTAMKALARADVPLPQLPRRVVERRMGEFGPGPGRANRHSTTYADIASYVDTYNGIAAAEEEEEEAAEEAAMAEAEAEERAEVTAAMALMASGAEGRAFSGHSRLSEVAASAGGNSSWMRPGSALAAAVAAAASGSAFGHRASMLRASEAELRTSGLVPTVSAARLPNIEDEDEGSSGAASLENSDQLPPLLKQLVSVRAPANATPRASGPVSEALEEDHDSAAVRALAGAPAVRIAAAYSATAAAASGSSPRTGGGGEQQQQQQQQQQQDELHGEHEQGEQQQRTDMILDSSNGGDRASPPESVHFPPLSPRAADGSHSNRLPATLPHGGAGSALLLQGGALMHNDRSSKNRCTRPTRFAVSKTPTDISPLDTAEPLAPEDTNGQVPAAADVTLATPPAAAAEGVVLGAASPRPLYGSTAGAVAAGNDDRVLGSPRSPCGSPCYGPNMEDLLKMRFTHSAAVNHSAPLPTVTGGSASSCVSSPKGRRTSVGPPAGAGRKQRRHSWLQASDGSQDGAAPGGSRKPRKDTLYVNSLLSNALVGAWAATQSVTGGRVNTSMARMLRPPLITTGGSTGGASNTSGFNTPQYRMPPTGVRSTLLNRSIASATAMGQPYRATASSGGLALHSALVNRLDMEESLASRKSQGFFAQLMFLLRRGAIKYVRSFWPMRVVDTLLQLAAAFIIGLVHGTHWGITAVPSNAVMCMVCLGVLSCVTHLRTFSNNRVLLWRESASGMSIIAYYLSQNVIDMLWVFAAPALSLGVYYYLTLPRMPFTEFYIVGLFVCWWASGMAYLVSAVLPPQNVLMAGVFISLIFGAFLNGLTYTIASARGTLMEGVMGLSYNRWAMEIVTVNELKYYQTDLRNTIIMMGKGIGLCGVDKELEDDGEDGPSAAEAISFMRLQSNFNMDYCNSYKSVAYVSLFALGLGFRLFALIFLRQNCVRRH